MRRRLLPPLPMVQSAPKAPASEPSTPLLAVTNFHIRDNRIKFIEDTHTYIIDGTFDPQLISVTTLVHKFFAPFDSDSVIDKMQASDNWSVSPYNGLTRDEIKKLWDDNRNDAATAGTAMHKAIEQLVNAEPVSPTMLATREIEMYMQFRADYSAYVPFRTEWVVFDETVKIAGSVDMVYRMPGGDANELAIYDWKRCKQIKFNNRWQKGLAPLAHLDDCNYIHYALQLNIYRRLIERNYSYIVRELCIVVLHPSQSTYLVIKLPFLDAEVDAIFASRCL